MSARRDQVLAAIDAANAADPRPGPGGKPFELDQSERLSAWITRLAPGASEHLRIAARGQHIERWTSPREKYPMDRGGYLRWREDLKKFHSRRVGEMMAAAGYAGEDLARVEFLISKAALRAGDAEGQALEDALCLVFLETQFDELRSKTPDDKMKEILRKTWRKMSEAGHAAALALPLDDNQRRFVQEALA